MHGEDAEATRRGAKLGDIVPAWQSCCAVGLFLQGTRVSSGIVFVFVTFIFIEEKLT